MSAVPQEVVSAEYSAVEDWLSSFDQAFFDEASGEWTLSVDRDGEQVTLKPTRLILATGYSSMNGWAVDLISQEVADKVGKCCGLGSDTRKDPGPREGELRNLWQPTQQPNLWFHGGNLHQSRHYSQFLSLQLKARMEGLPIPMYGLAEVHQMS